MSKDQLPLQLEVPGVTDYAGFIGHDDIINTLKNNQEMPSFCYLWGIAHSGKTHLMSAYNQDRQHQGDIGAVFSADVLMELDISEFLQENWDYMALDGIEVVAGNNQGERHLFNLFNACKASSVQLLVTAEISPRSHQWQLPDLISRLKSGLTLELSALTGRRALMLLRRQFTDRGIPVDEAVVNYIESHCPSDYGSLHKLLVRLDNHSLRDKRKITIPFVKHVLAES